MSDTSSSSLIISLCSYLWAFKVLWAQISPSVCTGAEFLGVLGECEQVQRNNKGPQARSGLQSPEDAVSVSAYSSALLPGRLLTTQVSSAFPYQIVLSCSLPESMMEFSFSPEELCVSDQYR